MHKLIFALNALYFCLLYLYLSFKAIMSRRKAQLAFGMEGMDKYMQATVRAHANFAEYAPLMLVLLLAQMLLQVNVYFMATSAIVAALGRTIHASSLLYFEHLQKRKLRYRRRGMALTFLYILIVPIVLLAHTLMYEFH